MIFLEKDESYAEVRRVTSNSFMLRIYIYGATN